MGMVEPDITGQSVKFGRRPKPEKNSMQGMMMRRRQLLQGAGSLALLSAISGCRLAANPRRGDKLNLTPIRADTDRITRITVCTRPFRAQGPRFDVEKIGSKTVIHNYGHGGSGWSLSWGSAAIVTAKALATGEQDIGVIGCGALGLTAALQLLRSGLRVTIYTKDMPPDVRSSLASGLYTPDSRICLEENATPAFKQMWERMARQTFSTFQSFLGLAGTPVEFIDGYFVSDDASSRRRRTESDPRPKFAELQRELTPDLIVNSRYYNPGEHNLGNRYLTRNSQLMFNLASYTRILMSDFAANGGKIQIMEFKAPDDLARLKEKTLINATGYGARALFSDDSVVPVRGQLVRMIPQPDVNYGLFYKHVSFVPRRDGLVFQMVGDNDYFGYNDETTVPDIVEAKDAVGTIAGLFAP
jgi:glycine/D-amino acid oxidase-like deaminating enzyme